VGDIAALPPGALERYLGSALGAHLTALSRGDDPRPVVPEQAAKSIGHEETFATDLWDRGDLHRHLTRMVDASATNLRQSGLAARTISVKIRFGDFTLLTRSHSMDNPIDTAPAIGAVAAALLDSVDLTKAVRLLGVSLAGFGDPDTGVQLSLDLRSTTAGPESGNHCTGAPGGGSPSGDDAGASEWQDEDSGDRLARAHDQAERIQQSWGSVTAAVDAIRARYGGSSVGPASLVGPEGLRVRARGEAQWGPTGGSAPKLDDG
jgi:hypothetical protein